MEKLKCIRISLLIVFTMLISLNLKAVNDSESIVAIGISNTENGAKLDAVKSAISTIFKVYSNDSIDVLYESGFFNEIDQGKKFEFINYEVYYGTTIQGISNNVAVLNVSCSIEKLKKYLDSKGYSVNIKLNELLYSIKRKALIEQSEINSISRLVGILHQLLQGSYNFSITHDNPISLNSQSTEWKIPLIVNVTANEYLEKGYYLCDNLLSHISQFDLDKGLIISNSDLKPVFISLDEKSKTFYLRKQISIDLFRTLENSWINFRELFVVKNGINDIYGWDKDWLWNSNNKGRSDYMNIPELKFYTANHEICTYRWDDPKNMEQLDKIKNYEVNRLSINYNYSDGGIKINDLNLILAPILKNRLGQEINGKTYFNGFDDWRYPTDKEMDYINRSIRNWTKLWGNKYEFFRGQGANNQYCCFDYSNVLVRNSGSYYKNKIKERKRTISINSTSTDARLFIDEKYVGLTPYIVTYSEGIHNLSIEKDGIKGESKIINFETLKDTNITLSLNTAKTTYLVEEDINATTSLKIVCDFNNIEYLRVYMSNNSAGEEQIWKELETSDITSVRLSINALLTDKMSGQKYNLELSLFRTKDVIRLGRLVITDPRATAEHDYPPIKYWSLINKDMR